jgi:hypothetical protein
MKAPSVKGWFFGVVFSLSRAFFRGRGWHGWLGDPPFFSFSFPVFFVPHPRVSS